MAQETTKTLRLERTFECSRQTLWEAWTDPHVLAKWFGPMDSTVVDEMDVRRGGKLRWAMKDENGQRYPIWGEYLVVDPPDELVFVAEAKEIAPHVSTVHVWFEERGESARLHFAQFGLPDTLAGDTGQGWQTSWKKLDRLLVQG